MSEFADALPYALDALPFVGAALMQNRSLRNAINPLSGNRGGWLCQILPWVCR